MNAKLSNTPAGYRGYDRDRSVAAVTAIYDTIRAIAERAQRESAPPEVIADRMAEEIMRG